MLCATSIEWESGVVAEWCWADSNGQPGGTAWQYCTARVSNTTAWSKYLLQVLQWYCLQI